MLNVFANNQSENKPNRLSASLEKERKWLISNLEKVISYYRYYEYAVRPDHLLVQILQLLPIRGNQSVYELHHEVEDKAPELARALHLFSAHNVGEVKYPGPFFGLEGEEVIILEDTSFDLFDAEENWEDLEPVRFLAHPKWDLNMEVPDGKVKGSGSGYAVIHIHPIKLAIQYKKWREREHYLNKEFHRSTQQFVYSHPLTNSLKSLVDVAYYNFLRRRFYDLPVEIVKDDHPFHLNVRYPQIQKAIDLYLLDNMRKRQGFEDFLTHTKAVTDTSLMELVQLPKVFHTQEITWALVMARLPTIEFYLEWERTANATTDRSTRNTIRREVRQLSSNRKINRLPGYLAEEIEERIEKNITPFI